MKREELFEAIGQMDEAFLAQAEQAQTGRPKRVLWKAVLAAAVILALSVSAMAAHVAGLFGEVRGNSLASGMWINGESVELPDEDVIEFYVDMSIDDEVPGNIETYYLPAVLPMENISGYSTESNEGSEIDVFRMYAFGMSWDVEEYGEYACIEFCQRNAQGYSPDMPVYTLFDYPEDIAIKTTPVSWDGFEGVCFSYEPWNELEVNTRILFWTDGTYIFRLTYPYDMPQEEVRPIVDSVEPVADIQPYFTQVDEQADEASQTWWKEFREEHSSGEPYDLSIDLNDAWTDISEMGAVRIWADISFGPNAGEYIEQAVYPKIFDSPPVATWSASSREEGSVWKSTQYRVGWSMPEYGEEARVYFTQMAAGQRPDGILDWIDNASSAQSVTGEMVTWGDYTFYEARFSRDSNGDPGQRILYWSDGTYIYSLHCPYAMEDAQVLAILDSIEAA